MKLLSKILNYTTKGAHAMKHFQNIKMELFGLLVIKNFKFQKYSDFFNDKTRSFINETTTTCVKAISVTNSKY